jgi:hypothetical protein
MSRPSQCSLHQEEFTFGEHPRKPTIRNAWFQQWNTRELMVGAAISWYSILLVPLLPFITELLQGSTWTGGVIWRIPWPRRYFLPNNDAVFQDDHTPIHTAGTVQSWFEEHEGELQHLPWPARSPDLNIIEPLWSVLETRVSNRSPPPISLKQLEDVLQEERYKIPLDTVQRLYESIPPRIAAVLKAKLSNTTLIKKRIQYL